MFKVPRIHVVICICFVLFYTSTSYSKEYLLEGNVDSRAEYNSNIFLTDLPHDSTKGVIITPSVSGVVKDENWEGVVTARIKSHNYTDTNLNSNDQFYDLAGRYGTERNIFSLNVRYDLASSLNSTSSDFGIVGRRVDRKNQSITPQYTYLLSERSVLSFSYAYSDVDYLRAENTGFTPYITESASSTFTYDLTEKDEITISLEAVDYASKDDFITYQLFVSRVGINHKFSQTVSADFLVGVSRRNSTNITTQIYDPFGNIIIPSQELDFKSRGLVLDAGISKLLERGKIEGRVSRSDTANSFGGLDQVDQLKINYDEKLSSLWRYFINVRIDDITSISSSAGTTDRTLLFFESKAFYSISDKWKVNGSYRYAQRKFKSDASGSRAPSSNRIYVGLTYNFTPLSTY